MKKAVIVGSRGQDGTLLSTFLESRKYTLLGIDQGSPTDVLDFKSVQKMFLDFQPDEIYYLAAFHRSSQEGASNDVMDSYLKSYQVHVQGLLHCLENMRLHRTQARLFFAASSHIFGNPVSSPQNELTPYLPNTDYAITKAMGLSLCRMYRDQHGLFASTGILYNHESGLRGPHFLSKKISTAVREIKAGRQTELKLGNLSAETDWGYAPDYVEAMWRILNANESGEFVLATGILHTVREYVEIAFAVAGLDWKKYVIEDSKVMQRKLGKLVGDSTKLRTFTGWKPSLDFKSMVELLTKQELNR